MMNSKQGSRRVTTELDILKVHHKFIRDDGPSPSTSRSTVEPTTTSSGTLDEWGERLAKKHYDFLYKDFGVVDLKHWRTRNIAIRWRTEAEVLSGVGETKCANIRCSNSKFNQDSDDQDVDDEKSTRTLKLKEFEIPFSYIEHGEKKRTNVRVRVCRRCAKKVKGEKEKGKNIKHERERDSENGYEKKEENRGEKRRFEEKQEDTELEENDSRKRGRDSRDEGSRDEYLSEYVGDESKEQLQRKDYSEVDPRDRGESRGNARH